MNLKKMWLVKLKIPQTGQIELNILLVFENPFPMFKYQIFNNCCSFGEGFVRK